MPRTEARIKHRIWDDNDFTALPMDAQWLYFAIMSSKHINHAGVGPIPRREWQNLAGDADGAARIAAAREVLEERRYIAVDERTDEVLVRTMIRNDDVVTGPPGTFRAAMASAAATVSATLRAILHGELLLIDRAYVATKKAGSGQSPLAAYDAAVAALAPSGSPSGRRTEQDETDESPVDSYGIPDGMRYAHGGGDGVGEVQSVGGDLGGRAQERAPAREARPHRTRRRPEARGQLPLTAPVDTGPPEPTCRKHRGWPLEDIPGCGACGAARERRATYDRETASADEAEVRRRRDACKATGRCSGNFLLGDDGQPAWPLVRCDHRDPPAGAPPGGQPPELSVVAATLSG